MLDEMGGGLQGGTTSIGDADIDDLLVRQCDTEVPIPRQLEDSTVQNPRIYSLNDLQSMALQLVCRFLDKYIANPDSAGQHLQYVGGPGGTGKSGIVDAVRDIFTARGQLHHLQVTGTSGSAAAQIGGTIHGQTV
ncbi:hypothetical protein NW759_017007 [Fusarium solani]|nr:hypothetical protein NW759_017007 [Fusarium solani]